MVLTSILYFFVIVFIRICQWVQLGILKLFSGPIRRMVVRKFEDVGTVLELPGSQSSPEDGTRILAKNEKYNRVIRLKVNNTSVITRSANLGVLGFGEAYMDGDWDYTESPDDITEFVTRVLTGSDLRDLLHNHGNRFLNYLELEAFNLQTRSLAWKFADVHYGLGNDLYEDMLDPWMQYTCSYWAKANNVNEAQLHKLELIAQKLDLKPGMRVVDFGCGWGTLCKYLAQNHGVTCVGVNICKEQVNYGRKACEGLPVDIRLQDYRDLDEKFDRVVSIGMIEHVGPKNHRTFLKVVDKCLKDDGIFLLHMIGVDQPTSVTVDPWIQKYIFPNLAIPRLGDIVQSLSGLFVTEDVQNIGRDYAKTLEAWRETFMGNWPKYEKKYGERFYRMWMFYLSMVAGTFKSRYFQVWQFVLTKNGLQREYRAAR